MSSSLYFFNKDNAITIFFRRRDNFFLPFYHIYINYPFYTHCHIPSQSHIPPGTSGQSFIHACCFRLARRSATQRQIVTTLLDHRDTRPLSFSFSCCFLGKVCKIIAEMSSRSGKSWIRHCATGILTENFNIVDKLPSLLSIRL